ncbi:MAG TPA: ferritin-like protein [Thermoanaerobaculia bacterium]|nr:ferritin-like protein [Thermoanaerobaculia bacterium]
MLYLQKRKLETVDDLRRWLLGAVRLELSTIPPYLTALYSLKPDTNNEIAKILRHIAVQEMLHMCLACNILNAVGGHPTINAAGFAPGYPTPLPMGIGTEPGKPFIVPLRRFSLELVQKIFMTIEEPEHPLAFPSARGATAGATTDYHTIGEFYRALERVIVALGDGIFTGDPALQVTGWFPSDELFPVTNVESAVEAIDIIVEQGEGTSTTPVDAEGGLSHYYLFSEIVQGKQLVNVPSVGFAYCGAPIPFDPEGVYPMVDNPPLVALPSTSPLVQLSAQFDESYTALLNALNATVNGEPSQLDVAIGLMYTLRLLAQQLMATPIDGVGGLTAGPRWGFASGYASG